MKKLIMFVMVLMLCMATTAMAAEPVALYCVNDSLEDGSPADNGYDASILRGTESYSSDVPPSGSGGSSFSADGETAATNEMDTCVFDDVPWSITFWFKTTGDSMMAIAASSPDAGAGQDNAIGIWLDADGAMVMDLWYVSAVVSETTGLNDGAWHHCAVVYEGSNDFTIYIDGEEDTTGSINYSFNCEYGDSSIFSFADSANEDHSSDLGATAWDGLLEDIAVYDVALDLGGVAESMDLTCGGVPNPIAVDPNDTTIYEDTVPLLPGNDNEGNFGLSFKFLPVKQGPPGEGTPLTVTFTVDPNGPVGGQGNPDFTLVDGSGGDNTYTFVRTGANYDQIEVIRILSVDDPCAEPPDLAEVHQVLVSTTTSPVIEPNLVTTKLVSVTVMDNDQAAILLNQVGPFKVWEQTRNLGVIETRTIKVTLQVQPSVGTVKLEVALETESDNPPVTDAPVRSADPNVLTFTAVTDQAWTKATMTSGWNVAQKIKVWGNDDAVLQVLGEEGEYPTADGGQLYGGHNLIFTVIEAEDLRYLWYVTDPCDPCAPPEAVGIEKVLEITVEDNECGAFGILPMDISNPYVPSDANYIDEEGNPMPDCYVDIYDAIEIARRWLDCSDPQVAGCIQYNE